MRSTTILYLLSLYWVLFPGHLHAAGQTAVQVNGSSLKKATLSRTGSGLSSGLQRVPNTSIRMPQAAKTAHYSVENAYPSLGLTQPIALVTPPGETNRFFVVEKTGRIIIVEDKAGATDTHVFLDLSSLVYSESESGMLGLAFHPQFSSNRYFYVTYTFKDPSSGSTNAFFRLSRFQVSAQYPDFVPLSSELPLITQEDENPIHEGGDLHFGPDGYLYFSAGDEGLYYNYYGNAQTIDKDFFGGIFRIDVDKRPGNLLPNPHPGITDGYLVPRDNPFVGATVFNANPIPDSSRIRTEHYNIGMRNPWRFSFDPLTGDLYSNDTGEHDRDEINFIIKGANYGWPFNEGTVHHDFPLPDGVDILDFAFPLGELDPTATGGYQAIAAGMFYRGNVYPNLNGHYLFSDYINNWIGVLNYDTSVLDAGIRASQAEITQLEAILNAPDPLIANDMAQWEEDWSGQPRYWSVLPVRTATAESGASIGLLADSTLSVTGTIPQTDTYTIVAETAMTNITAIRLEALSSADPSAPGPGRAAGGNFVLSEFEVSMSPINQPASSTEVTIVDATADFSQTDWPVLAAIDGDGNTGWAISPQTGKDHAAIFEIAHPIGFAKGTRFEIRLKQNYGAGAVLGRLRFSVSSDARPVPYDIAALLQKQPTDRTESESATLWNYYVSIDPDTLKMQRDLARLKAVAKTQLAAHQATWEQHWHDVNESWQIPKLISSTSMNGASLARQDDDSILVQGDIPWQDVYTVIADTDLSKLTGIRLELLPDESLPNEGPGRGAGGNAVLSELKVSASPRNGRSTAVAIPSVNAWADFSQDGWDVASSIDNDDSTGWAISPQVGQAHTAIFELSDMPAFQGGAHVRLELRQMYGNQATIGHFRIALTSVPQLANVIDVPQEIVRILQTPPEDLTLEATTALQEYYQSIDPNYAEQAARIKQMELTQSSASPRLASNQAQWENRWLAMETNWVVLEPDKMSSENGALLVLQSDKSILATSTNNWTDIYHIRASTALSNITAMRLEALTDDSLPNNGPGRGFGGNPILSDVRVLASSINTPNKTVQIALTNATADFSQRDFDATQVIGADSSSGWAISPLVGQPHEWVCEMASPVDYHEGTRLEFQLFQLYGGQANLGRFRISVTQAPPPVRADTTPSLIKKLLLKSLGSRTANELAQIAEYYRENEPALAPLRARIADLRRSMRDFLNDHPGSTELIAYAPVIGSFAVHPKTGEILMASTGTGTILKLVPAYSNSGNAELPATLAETGIFDNSNTLKPSPGVVPYAINVPFWSDGAQKRRWFSVPSTNATIQIGQDGKWSFPEGTIWVKHFDLEMTNGVPASSRPIETRVLVNGVNGFYGVTYHWDKDGKNASLVPDEGLDEVYTIQDRGITRTQVWSFPSRAQCLQCHTAVAGNALGFNMLQLNRDMDYGSGPVNQLRALSDAGYFNSSIGATETLPALAGPDETGISLVYRVRSYLHANCVQCHQPTGPGRGTWDARITVPLSKANLVDTLPAASLPEFSARIIKPGSVEDSILYQRLAQLGEQHMPPLGTHILNTQALALLGSWITNDLPSYVTYNAWQLSTFDPPDYSGSELYSDPDGDGANNYLEYLTHTNPRNASDVWRISVQPVSDGVRIRYHRLPNLIFQVYWTSTPEDVFSWQPLDAPGNQPVPFASEADVVIEDHPDKSQARFYQVMVQEP